jgi:hypothetical protein
MILSGATKAINDQDLRFLGGAEKTSTVDHTNNREVFQTRISIFDAEKEQKGFSTLDPEDEARWKRFLRPTLQDLEADFYYVTSHELICSNQDFQEKTKQTKFSFLVPPNSYHGMGAEEINACAAPRKDGYDVVYTFGQAVCDRLIAGILSTADLSVTGNEKLPLEEILAQAFLSIKRIGQMNSGKAINILDKKLFHLLDEAQLSRAKDLASLISRWTIAHEIGHVIRGHCDMPLSLKTPDVRKNNERDADNFAHNINNLSAFPEYSFLGGLANNLQMIALAGIHAAKDGNSHPSPLERLENLFKNTDSYKAFSARFNISKEAIFIITNRLTKKP